MGDEAAVPEDGAEPSDSIDKIEEAEEGLGDSSSAPEDRALSEKSEAVEEGDGADEDEGETEAPGVKLPAGMGEACVVDAGEEEAGEEAGGCL